MGSDTMVAVGDLVRMVNADGLTKNDPQVGDLVTVTAVRYRTYVDVRSADGQQYKGYLLTRFVKVMPTDPAPAPGLADVRAAYIAGSPDVRAALKRLYPSVAFTKMVTREMRQAVKDVPNGGYFRHDGVFDLYRRVFTTGTAVFADTTRMHVMTSDGRVCYYSNSMADEMVTRTDATGTPLTETVEVDL